MILTLTLAQKIAVWSIPLLLAITLHEAAHAWMAHRTGDDTAKRLGRLSLNPFRHIDPIGTILVPIVMASLSQFQFIFGWAKPVPVNWRQLNHPRRDMAFVALAGPLSNILMALLWTIGFKLAAWLEPQTSLSASFLLLTSQAGILINLMLAFVNLIPVPPLDGARVITSFLPPKYAMYYQKIEPFGFIILLALLYTGLLGPCINQPIAWSLSGLKILFNL